jgi:hypothetical protein
MPYNALSERAALHNFKRVLLSLIASNKPRTRNIFYCAKVVFGGA